MHFLFAHKLGLYITNAININPLHIENYNLLIYIGLYINLVTFNSYLIYKVYLSSLSM